MITAYKLAKGIGEAKGRNGYFEPRYYDLFGDKEALSLAVASVRVGNGSPIILTLPSSEMRVLAQNILKAVKVVEKS